MAVKCDGCRATVNAANPLYEEWAVFLVALPANTVPSVDVRYCPDCAPDHSAEDMLRCAMAKDDRRRAQLRVRQRSNVVPIHRSTDRITDPYPIGSPIA